MMVGLKTRSENSVKNLCLFGSPLVCLCLTGGPCGCSSDGGHKGGGGGIRIVVGAGDRLDLCVTQTRR